MEIRRIFVFFIAIPLSILAHNEWESTDFIWNFNLITSCDVGAPINPRDYFQKTPSLDLKQYERVKNGDILWVAPYLLGEFCETVLPHIQERFVLVVSDGDASFPSECLTIEQCQALLADERIFHIFAQNYDYVEDLKKVSPIPIGIDFHTVAYKGMSGGWGMVGSPQMQERMLMDCFQRALPTSQRKLRAFVDFQHSDTMHGDFKRYVQFHEDRTSIFEEILPSGVIDHSQWLNRGDLWKIKKEYAFSISPHGNGLDCHRTWEDLALGCIVIVKSSPLDPLYEGLPVVIIQDWSEINKANFQKWIAQYGDVSTNPAYRKKLTNHYWIKKIQNKAKELDLEDIIISPNEISYSSLDSKNVPLDHKITERLGRRNGVFVEVGAFDGLIQSNTKLLEEFYGWTGILIEPSAVLYKRLVNNRPRSSCFQCALGSFEQNNTYRYGDFDGELMSSMGGNREHRPATQRVLVRTLQSILDETHLDQIDFFSLDVEGYELNVLKGIDFTKSSFDYILIEIYKKFYNEILKFMQYNGYKLIENFTNYSSLTHPDWDGTHNDYLFQRIRAED